MTSHIPGMQIVVDFENAFKDIFAVLTNPDIGNQVDRGDETQISADFALENFQHVAFRLNAFFLQQGFLASKEKPDHFLAKDIMELQEELRRKEELIGRYHKKLEFWQKLMQDNNFPAIVTETSLIDQCAGTAGPSSATGTSIGAGPSTTAGPSTATGFFTGAGTSTAADFNINAGSSMAAGPATAAIVTMDPGPYIRIPMQAARSSINPASVNLYHPASTFTQVSQALPHMQIPVQNQQMHPHLYTRNAQPGGLPRSLGYMERPMSSFAMPDSTVL